MGRGKPLAKHGMADGIQRPFQFDFKLMHGEPFVILTAPFGSPEFQGPEKQTTSAVSKVSRRMTPWASGVDIPRQAEPDYGGTD
jgi:hypothetical protein